MLPGARWLGRLPQKTAVDPLLVWLCWPPSCWPCPWPLRRGPVFGFTFAEGYYPTAASDFLDPEGLPHDQLYNDVRFGGYLIERYAPSRLVFQDDRNEIHEPLLREILRIFQTTDVRAWNSLLQRHGCDMALVRYHPPLQVEPPDGEGVTLRGFSARWFPSRDWALVYRDDIAMVFVRRRDTSPELLERLEYRLVRPDDLVQLSAQLAKDSALRADATIEATRALQADPESRRALGIMRLLQHEVDTVQSDTN